MILDEETYLEHYGVTGMKWGVRKSRVEGVSRKIDREARKDAAEFARARAYYGQGAGTRRKLINQTIAGKEKQLPGYRKALDAHLAEQDSSKHVDKAVKERKRTDRSDKAKKTAGAVARRATGEWGTQAAFVAVAAGGAAYVQSPQGRAKMQQAVRNFNKVSESIQRRVNARNIGRYL